MNTYTPGPWITKWNNGIIDVFQLYENGSFSSIPHAKVIDDFACNTIRIQANSMLISAAPDLLAELIKITDAYAKAMKNAGVTHYPEALVEVKQARAAIAKATGGAK